MDFVNTNSISLLVPIIFLQIILIPGLIVLPILKFRNNVFSLIPIIFVISLVFNYVMVLTLTLLGIFKSTIILSIIAAEFSILIFLPKKILGQLALAFDVTKSQVKAIVGNNNRLYCQLMFLGALLSFGIFLISKDAFDDRVTGTGYVQVFMGWDPVVSWNRWATEWSSNRFPVATWEYPQLLPTNWALIYVMLGGNKIEFIPKILMYIFPVFGIFSFVGLGLSLLKLELIFGSAFSTYLIESSSVTGTVGVGYADLPVGTMVAILFASYFSPNLFGESNKLSFKNLLILGILGGGAIATKQPGLFGFASLVAMIYLNQLRDQKAKKEMLVLANLFVPAIIISGLWYFIKFFIAKEYSSNAFYLISDTHIHPESFIPKRMILSFQKYCTYPLFIVSAVFALIPRRNSLAFLNQIVWLYVIPWALIWSALYSYDNRNLFPIYPVLGVVAGTNLYFVFNHFLMKIFDFCQTMLGSSGNKSPLYDYPLIYIFHNSLLHRLKLEKPKLLKSFTLNSGIARKLSSLFLIFCLSLLLLLYFKGCVANFPNHYYLSQENRAKMHRGDYEINSKLLSFFSSENSKGKKFRLVATDYQYMGYVPGLENRYKLYFLNREGEDSAIKNSLYREGKNAAIQDPEIGYLLFLECPKTKVNTNKAKLIFRKGGSFCFYEKLSNGSL